MFVFHVFLFFSYFGDEDISISSSFFLFYMDKI